jgi:probable rRNA maturation factor
LIRIDIASEPSTITVDERLLRSAVRTVLKRAGLRAAKISLAIVDDDTIHALNRQYLGHDEPTDVLSFALQDEGETLEGEIIASAEMARRRADEFGWTPDDELLLYVIHGTLHLVGYDDRSAEDALRMRREEARVLAQFGLAPRHVQPPAHLRGL